MGQRATGFSLTELLIVVAIIGIIAAIAIPNLLNQRRQANEVQARITLRKLYSAQEKYAQGPGKGNYSNNLNQLPLFDSGICCLGCFQPLDQSQIVRSGYRLHLFARKDPITKNSTRYWAVSRPAIPTGISRTGNDMFYVDETGILRHSGSSTVWPDENSEPVR
ncbi:MAG: prepilin-type N-terminal cleavage/methylation domain-containing protein [Blastocatellia bacterium]|nr:prepilin-type N-terminal cleavage/methylation domain-containing protein [Blastocatellia bacterium]